MGLRYLYYTFGGFWSGYTHVYIVVEGDKLRFEKFIGHSLGTQKLYHLSDNEKKRSSRFYNKGYYRGDTALWLKLFEQVKIDEWGDYIQKSIVDGTSATVEWQINEQSDVRCSRCVNCYPETFDLLMKLIEQIDLPAPCPVYGKLMSLEFTLSETKHRESIVIDRTQYFAQYELLDEEGYIKEKITDGKIIDILDRCNADYTDYKDDFYEHIKPLTAVTKDKLVPHNIPDFTYKLKYEYGEIYGCYKYHRRHFESNLIEWILSLASSLFSQFFSSRFLDRTRFEGKMLSDEICYYRTEAGTFNEHIYDCFSFDDSISEGDNVIFFPAMLDSYNDLKCLSCLDSSYYLNDDDVYDLFLYDKCENIPCCIIGSVRHKNYEIFQDIRDKYKLLLYIDGNALNFSLSEDNEFLLNAPNMKERVFHIKKWERNLTDEYIIYCILRDVSGEIIPHYFKTKCTQYLPDSEITVRVSNYMVNAEIIEMRIYYVTSVPVPLDEVPWLDD